MTALARRKLEAGDKEAAALLAIEAMPDRAAEHIGHDGDWRDSFHLMRPYIADAERVLYQALDLPRPLAIRQGPAGAATALAFSPDGRLLLAASAGGAHLIEAETGALRARLGANRVGAVAFSNDNRLAVTAGQDGKVRIWSVAGGALVATLDAHGAPVRSIAFPRSTVGAPTQRTDRFASIDADGLAIIWNPLNARGVARIETGPSSPPCCLLLVDHGLEDTSGSTPLQNLELLVGNDNGAIRRYRSKGETVDFTLVRPAAGRLVALQTDPHEEGVMAVLRDENGVHVETVGAGSSESHARHWLGRLPLLAIAPNHAALPEDPRQGTDSALRAALAPSRQIEWQPGYFRLANYSRESGRFAVAMPGGQLALWCMEHAAQWQRMNRYFERIPVCREAIATFDDHAGNVAALAFDPWGKRLAVAGEDGRIAIWRAFAYSQDLVFYARAIARRCLTPDERNAYHLTPEPPSWCKEMSKPPYAATGEQATASPGAGR